MQPLTRSVAFWLAALLVVAATLLANVTYYRFVDRNRTSRSSSATVWRSRTAAARTRACCRATCAPTTIAIALLLLSVVWRRGLAAFAIFAALFWAWNRWTLFEILVAQIAA